MDRGMDEHRIALSVIAIFQRLGYHALHSFITSLRDLLKLPIL